MSLAIEIVYLDEQLRTNAELQPQRATAGAAALDLRAAISTKQELAPHTTVVIPAGFAIHIKDPNYCALILPRSGLGTKHGIVLANTVGLIDSDYTGEIKLAITNQGNENFTIEPYMRLCQLIFTPVIQPELQQVEQFSVASERSSSGFGSTGTN